MKELAVIVPVHNECANIKPLVEAVVDVAKALPEWSTRIWFVDDGSTDDTVARIRECGAVDDRVGLIRLTRNFGHQAALQAGLMETDADAFVTMDGDLQHPPAAIPQMVAALKDGVDVVQMARETSSGGAKGAGSFLFYRMLRSISDVPIVPDGSDFRLITRHVRDALRMIPEREKFLRGLIPQLGFRQKTLTYRERPRAAGTASYTFAA